MITKISNEDAQNELWAIEYELDCLEDYQNNPGVYFPKKMQAEAAMAAWEEKYPESEKERRFLSLIEVAENKERLAKEANIYGDSETQDERIESFTKQAEELRAKAAAIFE